MTRISFFAATLCLSLAVVIKAESKLLSAYISDSPSSSVPAWIAKETGLFKKYGLDVDLVSSTAARAAYRVFWQVT